MGEEFQQKLEGYVEQIAQYHDPAMQGLARALLPVEEFEEKAAIALAKEGKFQPTKEEENHFFLIQLLHWFKTSFKWVNSPSCDFCASNTHHIGMGEPSAEDLQFGASRVEIHSCELCGTVTRFPRYNSPAKLMETQCGRCGEWANCFTFYCVALGYNARLVLDFTDHVWTECYSPYLGRWVHLDPCEASYDTPLLYEKGWGKKLNYVIAVAKDGVYDVTKRYTRKWPEVVSRRNLVSEETAEEVVALLTAIQRSKLEPEELDILEQRDRQEAEELSGAQASPETDQHLPGRQSGSKEWREVRGEMGVQHIESDRSFCPARLCADEHVGKIYQAIGLLCSQERSTAEKELALLHDLLIKLKRQPFRARSAKLESTDETQLNFLQSKGGAAWLDGIGMKQASDGSGGMQVTLKEPPGKAALALVTALENVEKVTKKLASQDMSSLQLMLQGRRLCGGLVYATGEQMPSGTASAAFDGHYSTKWEEPGGAKGVLVGATLVYHLHGNASQHIVGYDLTSANDCPERDPLDWMLEGSCDGGKTWQLLDKRSGELFQERYERRCFIVAKESQFPCSVLRLQFAAVRETVKTSRLQLSSIDFYLHN
ncbi:peptide-N(4)-(N-acetyl-beta-glucosaminyl)asparagine amidase [Selaginella moellendorffii]|uniref:peptide-N(4)-(N-acetyl-beta- glucosaminyl)asparagine amidase n=1 Tax=Selaginella moellendorffii TaxID=88036 RepID=UPI000D1CB02E|nr:peptide-N(4)-(N-acetyl-beta-glucosaminyl)asparagine amidase [Selaginella moellendorffii]|eukprot:XP_024528073.1 peptide-N(4)-(N-acetyl-beta-glucosaminyl)asparagine amidase [Selaginella moellendorffii]